MYSIYLQAEASSPSFLAGAIQPSNIPLAGVVLLMHNLQPLSMLLTAGEPLSTPPASFEAGPPTYELFAAQTVQQAWREWKEGLCGFPPLEQLEHKWGAALRPASRQGQAWHYWKVILDEVLCLMQSGFPMPEQAVAELDHQRDKLSLCTLAEHLKKKQKEVWEVKPEMLGGIGQAAGAANQKKKKTQRTA